MIEYVKMPAPCKCVSCGTSTQRNYTIKRADGTELISMTLCGSCCNKFSEMKIKDLTDARDKFRETSWTLRHVVKMKNIRIQKMQQELDMLRSKNE